MKRFLIVLFGVLVFQGSVWATTESCLKNWPHDPDGPSVTKAKILFPVTEGKIIAKKSPFGVVWHETGSVGDWLGAHVNIRLYEQGKEQDLFKNRLLNKPNTGFFMVNKKDFRAAGVKNGKQYYFVVQKTGDKAAGIQIQSGCFTFDIKAKEEVQCVSATNTKECLKVLISQNRGLLERMSELEGQITASPESGSVRLNSVQSARSHTHPEYAGSTHSHEVASSSHTHEINQGIARVNLDNNVSDEQVIEAMFNGFRYPDDFSAADVHKMAQPSTPICYSPSQQEWVVGVRPPQDYQGRTGWSRQNENYFREDGEKIKWTASAGATFSGASVPDWVVIHPANREDIEYFDHRLRNLYWDAARKNKPPLSDQYIKERVDQIREGLGIETLACGSGILDERPVFPSWAGDKRTVSQDNLAKWESWEEDTLRPYLQAARVCVLPGLIDTSARWAEAFMWGDFEKWPDIFGRESVYELSAYKKYMDHLGSGATSGIGTGGQLERPKGANSPNPPRRIDDFVCENERHVLADSDLYIPVDEIAAELGRRWDIARADGRTYTVDPFNEVVVHIYQQRFELFGRYCAERRIPGVDGQDDYLPGSLVFEAVCRAWRQQRPVKCVDLLESHWTMRLQHCS